MRKPRKLQTLGAIRGIWAALKYPQNIAVSNPEARAEIPADFPGTISPYSAEAALQIIEEQLAKRGLSLDAVNLINIVYPQKHPGLYPDHHNSAAARAEAFQQRMERIAPHIDWVMANSIVERVRLGRSENQSSFHALTAKQSYDIYAPSPLEQFRFNREKGSDLFVIVDNTIEQGTTVANLISFIRHNGGEVLLVQADHHADIAQKRAANNNGAGELGAPFNDAARNTGRLPELAAAFSKSAARYYRNITPAESIATFEAALQPHGNSVFALTDGEVNHLLKELREQREDFLSLVAKLEKSAPKQPFIASYLGRNKA